MEVFVATFLKMFFIMTPFFVLSIFITVTNEATKQQKKALAIKVTISVIVISLIILFFGKYIFAIFGVTLDAFRIGAGALLFLSAVDLVRGSKEGRKIDDDDIIELAVVPLALPITIGPGAIGILLIMGASFENTTSTIVGSIALVSAIVVIGFMLYSSTIIEKFLGKQGLVVVSKITGIFVAAISAQIMFTGIKNFLGL